MRPVFCDRFRCRGCLECGGALGFGLDSFFGDALRRSTGGSGRGFNACDDITGVGGSLIRVVCGASVVNYSVYNFKLEGTMMLKRPFLTIFDDV